MSKGNNPVLHGCGMRFLWCTITLLCAGEMSALEIHIAPLVTVSREMPSGFSLRWNPQNDFLRRLRENDHSGALSAQILPERIYTAPRSFLDAARLCEAAGIDYLLYGYLQETDYSWDCEIKLYVREINEVVQLFLGRDSRDNYLRMLDGISRHILDYFYVELGLAPYSPPPEPDRKIFSIPIHLAYWCPGGGDWSGVSTGIGRIESGILFVPASPLWYHGGIPWELQTGVTFSWSLAVNEKEYESFLLHSLRINLPLLAAAELTGEKSIALGGGLSMQFDILNQDRQYYGNYRALSAAPGVFVEADYRYRLNNNWKLGFHAALEFAFFRDLQSSVVTGVYGLYSFEPLDPSADRQQAGNTEGRSG